MLKFVLIEFLSIFAFFRQTNCVVKYITNENYDGEYIFQDQWSANFTFATNLCRELHNAEFVKFETMNEFNFVASSIRSGNYLIGLYIPSNGDYRNLTWYDGTPVDLNEFKFKFRRGTPGFNTTFRYFYIRGYFGDIDTSHWWGSFICKWRLDYLINLNSASLTAPNNTIFLSIKKNYRVSKLECGMYCSQMNTKTITNCFGFQYRNEISITVPYLCRLKIRNPPVYGSSLNATLTNFKVPAST